MKLTEFFDGELHFWPVRLIMIPWCTSIGLESVESPRVFGSETHSWSKVQYKKEQEEVRNPGAPFGPFLPAQHHWKVMENHFIKDGSNSNPEQTSEHHMFSQFS